MRSGRRSWSWRSRTVRDSSSAAPPSTSRGRPPYPKTVVEAIRLEQVTVREGGAVLCRGVSLSVAAASVYALLGEQADARTAVIRCILGHVRPAEGRVLVFGEAPRRARKRIARVGGEARRRWSFLPAPPRADEALAAAIGRGADLLLLDDPAFDDPGRARQVMADAVRQGRTVLFATSDPSRVELLAHRVGILAGGRLVLDEELMKFKHAFRRIRYSNEMTETRSEYGNELDSFDAVSVKVRGWGIEAIVSDFDEEKFARFRAMDGVLKARAEALSLTEIFEAVRDRSTTSTPRDLET